jgi:hypothetical protein
MSEKNDISECGCGLESGWLWILSGLVDEVVV